MTNEKDLAVGDERPQRSGEPSLVGEGQLSHVGESVLFGTLEQLRDKCREAARQFRAPNRHVQSDAAVEQDHWADALDEAIARLRGGGGMAENLEDRALNALLAWESARQRLNRLVAERSGHRCEYAERAEPEVGDPGVAPCWMADVDDTDDVCESCKRRRLLTPDIEAAKKEQSRLRQKMQREAAKLLPFGNGTQRTSEIGSVPSEAP